MDKDASSPLSKGWAVLAAGGQGERFGGVNKLLVPLGGEPVLLRSLQALWASGVVSGVVGVAPAASLDAYAQLCQAAMPPERHIRWVAGGATRRDSVWRGLEALPLGVEWVAIHDAARPLLNPAHLNAAVARLQAAPDLAGVVVGLPVRDTVKQVTLAPAASVVQTLDRETLWLAQTPQVFRLAALRAAHQAVPADEPVTDDAQLLERSGLGNVAMVPGSPWNLKITTPDDLILAEALWRSAQAHPAVGSAG